MNDNDLLDAASSLPPRWHAPQEPTVKQYGKKIAGGICCSAFVAFLMHLPHIKAVILWACHIVILVFGRPEGVEKVENKLKDLAGKGREVVKAHAHPVDAVADTGEPQPGRVEKYFHNKVEKLRDKAAEPAKKIVATAVEKGEEIKGKADEGVKAVKDGKDEVVGAVKQAGEAIKGGAVRARDAVVNLPSKLAGDPAARAAAQEKMRRDALEARAAAVKLDTNKDWSLARLNTEVSDAERKWQAKYGPNASCPYCRYGLRIRSKRAETLRCAQCGGDFPSTRGLRLGPPPRIPVNPLFRR